MELENSLGRLSFHPSGFCFLRGGLDGKEQPPGACPDGKWAVQDELPAAEQAAEVRAEVHGACPTVEPTA